MFDWDEGNIDKNLKHGVQDWEIEEACQDPRSCIIGYRLVKSEWRYVLLGRSATSGKYLRVVYTLRTAPDGETLIRPISAVEMSVAQRRR
ncbi:MAG: BrnT family toxin [Anaerolineae bacterium]|nr:BrnT family toxin [Anaerolineae bacterium]